MSGHLQNKNILLGICGGIAAYKCAELVRRLRDDGADVRVVMTQAATEFVTPLTFQALSSNPVHTDLLDSQAEAAMGHIELARWADLVLIAPATANTLARLAHGEADDLLSTICLATEAPRALAPAMNHIMWAADSTQNNITQLQQQGYSVFGPASGSQACGETGAGRLLETPELLEACRQQFQQGLLQGKHILITAGPTHEPIDPVRYIGNRSSGKMGFALAEAAVDQGADVTLISGPTNLLTPQHVTRIDVETALQMHSAVMQNLPEQDIFIATAAVADFRPAQTQPEKIKKQAHKSPVETGENTLSLQLVANPDILADVAAQAHPPYCLGFAAETQQLEEYALKKMHNKKLNMIAANLVGDSDEDSGFNSEYNSLQVFWKNGNHEVHSETLQRQRKSALAIQLIKLLAQHYQTEK